MARQENPAVRTLLCPCRPRFACPHAREILFDSFRFRERFFLAFCSSSVCSAALGRADLRRWDTPISDADLPAKAAALLRPHGIDAGECSLPGSRHPL